MASGARRLSFILRVYVVYDTLAIREFSLVMATLVPKLENTIRILVQVVHPVFVCRV